MYAQRSDRVVQLHTAHNLVKCHVGSATHRPAEATRLYQQGCHRFVEVLVIRQFVIDKVIWT